MILLLRYSLKLLLTYTTWMYETRGHLSLNTKIWLGVTKLLNGRNPMLYRFQDALPKMSVPSIENAIARYLCLYASCWMISISTQNL